MRVPSVSTPEERYPAGARMWVWTPLPKPTSKQPLTRSESVIYTIHHCSCYGLTAMKLRGPSAKVRKSVLVAGSNIAPDTKLFMILHVKRLFESGEDLWKV